MARPNSIIDTRFDPVIVVALSMLAGCIGYFSLPIEPDLNLVIGTFSGLAILYIWLRRRHGATLLSWILLFLFAASLGLCTAKLASSTTQTITLSEPLELKWVEGWVERVEAGPKGGRLRIKVHAIQGLSPALTPQNIRLTHRASLRVEPGRFVRCWASLRPPPTPVIAGDYPFDRQAWYEGLGAVGYVQGRCRGGALGLQEKMIEQLRASVHMDRRALARHVNTVAGPHAGGFAAALASGDRSFMQYSDQEALRAAGLAHLMAISGLHMGIVGGLIYLVFWRGLALIEPLALRVSVRKPAAMIALLASFAYLVLSGASVSTQRAFIMALVFFGSVLVDRTALSLRSCAIAMIAVLLIAPWSALSPGFQMSFAATAALIVTYDMWRRKRAQSIIRSTFGPVFWIQSLFVTSLVSSLATMPFALLHFDRFAGLGLFANLAAMPIISLLSAPLAGLALFLSPLGLDNIPLYLFGLSLSAVLEIAHRVSDIPFGNIVVTDGSTLALICICAGGLICRLLPLQRLTQMRLTLALCLTMVIWTVRPSPSPILHWAPNGTVYLEERLNTRAITVRRGTGLAPLRFAQIAPTASCDTSALCNLPLPADYGHAVYTSELTPRICQRLPKKTLILVGGGDSKFCTNDNNFSYLAWNDIVDANGVSLRLTRSEPTPIAKLQCGQRPWFACSASPNAVN